MTTNNHEPIVTGESNAPTTINTRLAALDAAIGSLSASGVSGASAAAQVATLRTIINNLDVENSSAEVGAARNAGLTNGAISNLSDRVDFASERAYHPKAYGATGDGATNDRDALNTLMSTTMSANGGRVVIDRGYAIASSLSVPNNVQLDFSQAGQINVASGQTLTIRGPVVAPPVQIFTGTGTVKISASDEPFTHSRVIEVYPEWWGARKPGATSTENKVALQAAIDSLNTGHATRKGGVVRLGAGRWDIDGTITITYDSVTIQGSGQQNTVLDFDDQTSGNAIEVRGAKWVKLKDFSVYNAFSHGIAMLSQTGGYSVWNNNEIYGVRVQACGGSGIYLERGFMSVFWNVFSGGNATDGWTIRGYNTSCTFISCYGNSNTSDGFDIGPVSGGTEQGFVYSSFISCGSDNNGGFGYRLRGSTLNPLLTTGISFVACGSESNVAAGWYLDGTIANSILRAVSFTGCLAFANNTGNAWSNFLYANAAGAGASISQITIQNCTAFDAGAGTSDVVSSGTGSVLIVDNCNFEGTVSAVSSGTIYNRDTRNVYTVTNRTTDRTYDANSSSTDELADVLGTLILDLQAKGIVG